MKVSELEKAFRETPVHVPVFRMLRVPEWARVHDLYKGDFVEGVDTGTFRNGQGHQFGFGATAVKFVGYYLKGEIFDGQARLHN